MDVVSGFSLYPAIDIQSGRAVRPTGGRVDDASADTADPVELAASFVAAGATWLHVVDLDAAYGGAASNRHLVADIVRTTGVRIQASGGVRTMGDVEQALEFGADRVVIGTLALDDLAFVGDALAQWGSALAVALDVDGDELRPRGWDHSVGPLTESLGRLVDLGVARFVCTDVTRDGMLNGPNLDLLAHVAESTDAAVTASGGIRGVDDLRELARLHPRVDGAIVGKAFHVGVLTVSEALDVIGTTT